VKPTGLDQTGWKWRSNKAVRLCELRRPGLRGEPPYASVGNLNA
jgi:hypothetical protein